MTRHFWGEAPTHGCITFVNPAKVRKKRDPGRCFRKAGFHPCGLSRERRYLALQLLPADMPDPLPPRAPRAA